MRHRKSLYTFAVKKEGIVHFRAEQAVIDRLEKLATSHPELKAAAFARMALLEGLPLIEAKYLPEAAAKTRIRPAQAA